MPVTPRSQFRTFAAVSTCIGIAVVLHYVGFLKPVEQFFRGILTPGSRSIYQWSVTVNDETESFSSVSELETAYGRLLKLYQEALVDQAKFAQLQTDNGQLREQLHFLSATNTAPHVGAAVIGKNIEALGSTIIVDRGGMDGIQIGQPVIVGKGILVGKVKRVEDTQSVIELINDPESRIAGTIQNNDKSIGLIEGGYGISVRMEFIPQNETVRVGDVIVTSGLEASIPRGLLIGTIEAVEKEAYQPFQRAVITPVVSLDKLTLVSIILTSE